MQRADQLNALQNDLNRLQALYQHAHLTQLMAVSKTQPVSAINDLLKAGHRLFGENRVQEAGQKWPLLKQTYPDCRLHLIGPLQTNKVKEAIWLFDMIETVDRPKLAECLADHFQKQQRVIPLLIQVNTGREPQKAGIAPEEVNNFFNLCQQLQLPIQGFMAIPPVNEDPEPHFASLLELKQRFGLSYLSMGMSHDYPQAVKYQSSWVRIGTALFGQRC